jgi:hypothetical protein
LTTQSSANVRKLTIPITPDFRLVSDGDRNYSLEQRVTIDPTKAPGYKADEHAEPPPKREVWRGLDAHYPFNKRGLVAAIEAVIIRQADVDIRAAAVPVNLADYVAKINAISTYIDETLAYAFSVPNVPEVSE